MNIAIDEKGHYHGNLHLSGWEHPLPENLTSIGGHLDLWGYNYPLPAGLTSIGGSIDLENYAHPLPAGLAHVGGKIEVSDYRHSLSVGLISQAPFVENIDEKIFDAVCKGAVLDMSDWHSCETAHCRAGWAIYFAGEAGKELELRFGSEAAGALIYERATGRRPDFYANDEDAWADICQSVSR